MRRPSRRAAAIGAVALVAAGVVVGGALAAAGTFDPAKERQAFLNDAAGRLGVSSAKLEDALKQAAIDRVDAALAAGEITQAQADAMKAAINSGKAPLGLGAPGFRAFGPGFGFGPGLGFQGAGLLSSAATYLGLTEAQLATQLQSGKSLADIAKAQGKTVDGLKQAMTADVQSKLDQAVKDGRITSAQRDQILAEFKSHLDDLINHTPSGPLSGAYGNGFRFGPGGFHAPFPAGAPAAFLPTA